MRFVCRAGGDAYGLVIEAECCFGHDLDGVLLLIGLRCCMIIINKYIALLSVTLHF